MSYNLGEVNKPPIGIIPFKFWNEQRKQDIEAAIIRYVVAGKEVPRCWVAELQTINAILKPEE